jgi:hypothetical protein
MRTGDCTPNGHEQYISFHLVNLINLGQKTISLMLGQCTTTALFYLTLGRLPELVTINEKKI